MRPARRLGLRPWAATAAPPLTSPCSRHCPSGMLHLIPRCLRALALRCLRAPTVMHRLRRRRTARSMRRHWSTPTSRLPQHGARRSRMPTGCSTRRRQHRRKTLTHSHPLLRELLNPPLPRAAAIFADVFGFPGHVFEHVSGLAIVSHPGSLSQLQRPYPCTHTKFMRITTSISGGSVESTRDSRLLTVPCSPPRTRPRTSTSRGVAEWRGCGRSLW